MLLPDHKKYYYNLFLHDSHQMSENNIVIFLIVYVNNYLSYVPTGSQTKCIKITQVF